MTTSMNLNLDANFDLNSVFTLQYNFDLLKAILESLLKTQTANSQKIKDFEGQLDQKDKRISQLQNDLDFFNVYLRNPNINNSEGNVVDLKNSELNDDILKTIMNKIVFLESQNKVINIFGNDLTEIKRKISQHDDSFRYHMEKFDDLFRKLNDLNDKYGDLSLTDVLDKKLSKTESSGEGKFDLIINLVKNLESKLNNKISADRKIEDDLNLLKKEMNTVKINLVETDKAVRIHTDEIDNIYNKLNELKKEIITNNNINRGTYQDMLDKLKSNLDKKFEEFDMKLLNLPNNSNITTNETNDADSKLLKDFQKRLSELEKNFKFLSGTINLDQINKEITSINEKLMNKVGQQEFKELKDNQGQLLSIINFLKENTMQLQEDQKRLSDDYSLLKRKIENLTNLLNLKNSEETTREKESFSSKYLIHENNNNKYVEINTFNEYKLQISKELDAIKFSINDLKASIEEILNRLKSKAEERDLKELELFLINKIEELKSASNKKFADKNETAKNLKYLDSQIKQIIEVNIKRMDKGENWLLAKKPLEGFNCASCEAYIGDLKENNEYIPWNKYPMRDTSDKLYRMGNGFSKMLQYINLEGYMNSNGNNMNLNLNNHPANIPNKKNQTSQDFYKRPQDPSERREFHLPKVKSNKKNLANMSDDDIEVQNENENNNVDDPLQPKM